ncbi:hypothetical protein B4135_3383 [Caldibacillus debilis]|uniref:Uncharacterized protein n=1 Tax=Caldibacillus debilis TaxID=301148 RepID=A0A150LFP9_9BACI|nr:hypothetical protein B4135_3383 [Caldibacillus debilis]
MPPALLGWADGAFSAEKTLRNEPEGFADGCRGGKRRPATASPRNLMMPRAFRQTRAGRDGAKAFPKDSGHPFVLYGSKYCLNQSAI